jgi:hypothetical protein
MRDSLPPSGKPPHKKKAAVKGLPAIRALPVPTVKVRPAFVRLEALTCWPHARQMLAEGYSTPEVADFIQQTNGEYPSANRDTLADNLADYRRERIPTAAFLSRSQIQIASWVRAKLEDETLEYGRLEELYALQRARIDRGLRQEERVDAVVPAVGAEVRCLADLVYRMHAVKTGIGLDGRADMASVVMRPETVEQARQRWGEGVAAALKRPAARGKVLDILRQIKDVTDNGDAYGYLDTGDSGPIIDILSAPPKAEGE